MQMNLVQFALPRRTGICGEAEYTKKTRGMEINLFNFHSRVPQYMWPQAKYTKKPKCTGICGEAQKKRFRPKPEPL